MEKTPDYYLCSTYRIMSSRTDLGKILISFFVGKNPKVPERTTYSTLEPSLFHDHGNGRLLLSYVMPYRHIGTNANGR